MKLFCFSAVAVCLALASTATAQPFDFTEFEVELFPPTDGFPDAFWDTTLNEARIDEAEGGTPNASASVLFGTESVLGKRIVGDVFPGPRDGRRADDDMLGLVFGIEFGDGDFFNPDAADANYVLIDWKGTSQSFNFEDPPGGDFFNGATLGGPAPAGLAISQVTGLPTADELWQHVDSEDGIDGGVVELARANTLGNVGYNRSPDAEPYVFDVSYTEDRITVIVDGIVQLDVTGEFEDGGFGVYSGWMGPTPVFANFTMFDEVREVPEVFPEVTVDRESGELVVRNGGSEAFEFSRYFVTSDIGVLSSDEWTTISGNLDNGSASSLDDAGWTVDSSLATELSENAMMGTDGAAIPPAGEFSLGSIWTASQFEDLVFFFQQGDGLIAPVVPEFVGNGGEPYGRSDLNTDGTLDLQDWLLFFPNTLTEFSELSQVQASLLGDIDGDFDNDVDDFALFRADYDLANGDGAFAAMAATVPEPNAILLAVMGLASFGLFRSRGKRHARNQLPALCSWIRNNTDGKPGELSLNYGAFSNQNHVPSPGHGRPVAPKRYALMLLCLVLFVGVSGRTPTAQAQLLDFTEFTLERFPPTDGFAEAEWDVTENTATILGGANASANVYYSPMNVLGKRIRGFLDPSTDDDQVGLVLGFQPGDASFGDDSQDADYLLIDWKGVDQSFNFNDPADPDPEFNNLTGGGLDPAGLALSRVTGLANSDELWQHANLEGNTLGGIEELSRAFTLGRTPYDRDPNSPPVEFDILFEEDQVVVIVDGSLEFFQSGSFSDGRFGLYTGWQSGGPEFTDFELLEPESLDLSTLILRAEVDRASGDITISNNTGESVDLDFYQFDSLGGSLAGDWNGLSDAEMGADADPGVAWVKAGGAGADSIAELYLVDSAGNLGAQSLAQGGSLTLGGAYNSAINAEDLSFRYRFPDGSLNAGLVSYVGEAPVGGGLDCNGDGQVTLADLACSNGAGNTGEVLTALSLLQGDFDGDGSVAFADFLVLSGNFGEATESYLAGDVDASGTVDFADFLAFSANFGQTAVAPVPEPSAACLMLCGFVFGLAFRRRKV